MTGCAPVNTLSDQAPPLDRENTFPRTNSRRVAGRLTRFRRDAPVGGDFGAPHEPEDTKLLGPMQQITLPPRRFKDSDEIDFAIVGVGSAGGVLLQRLARAGFSVVGVEAGPFWDTERQWVSDEAGSHNLYWNDLRITGGKDPLALGSNNAVKV